MYTGHRGATIMYSMWKMCFWNLKTHKHIALHQIHKIMFFLATSYFLSSAPPHVHKSCYNTIHVTIQLKCTFVHQPSDESDPNHGRIWQAEQKSFLPRFSSFLWQRSERNDRTPPIREDSADTTQRDTHTANTLNASYRFQMLNVDDIANHSTVNQPLDCWKKNVYVLFCLRLV